MATVETVIQKAIDTYGYDLQKQVAIEEMSELTKEICKDFRGKDNKDNIIEEIADVDIMLTQLMIIYNIKPYELDEVKTNKLVRLSERLKGEKTWIS